MMANAKLIHFDSGGVKCAADLYLPDAGAYVYPRPGVVMGHGFSVIKSALVQQATYLVNAGYVVMAIENSVRVVDLALRAVGGQSYFKRLLLERLFRDVWAGLFHPLDSDETLELLDWNC